MSPAPALYPVIEISDARMLALQRFELRSVPLASVTIALDRESQNCVTHLVVEQWLQPLVTIGAIKLARHDNTRLPEVAGGEGSFLRARAPGHRIVEYIGSFGKIGCCYLIPELF